MPIKRGHLYIIDFNPRIKTKPGMLRPALVPQSDLVNEAEYPSTIVIPTTTRLVENPGDSSVSPRLKRGQGGVTRDSDLLLGQVIAVANASFRSRDWLFAEFYDGRSGKSYPHHSEPLRSSVLAYFVSARPFIRDRYLITLSAWNSTVGGIVTPICFAVLRLITNSNFVGCATGRSAGFAPLRILST